MKRIIKKKIVEIFDLKDIYIYLIVLLSCFYVILFTFILFEIQILIVISTQNKKNHFGAQIILEE